MALRRCRQGGADAADPRARRHLRAAEARRGEAQHLHRPLLGGGNGSLDLAGAPGLGQPKDRRACPCPRRRRPPNRRSSGSGAARSERRSLANAPRSDRNAVALTRWVSPAPVIVAFSAIVLGIGSVVVIGIVCCVPVSLSHLGVALSIVFGLSFALGRPRHYRHPALSSAAITMGLLTVSGRSSSARRRLTPKHQSGHSSTQHQPLIVVISASPS